MPRKYEHTYGRINIIAAIIITLIIDVTAAITENVTLF